MESETDVNSWFKRSRDSARGHVPDRLGDISSPGIEVPTSEPLISTVLEWVHADALNSGELLEETGWRTKLDDGVFAVRESASDSAVLQVPGE